MIQYSDQNYQLDCHDDKPAHNHSDKEPISNQQTSPGSNVIIELRKSLPVIFTRKFVCEKLGGIVSEKALAILDSRKQGPTNRIAFSKKIAYERDSFLDWLEKRLIKK